MDHSDKDYRLEIKVRNAPMLRAMHAAGYYTAVDLARASGVSHSHIGRYLGLKQAPYGPKGLRPSAETLSIALKQPVEKLFPEQHLYEELQNNRAEIDVSLDDIRAISGNVDVEQLVGDRMFAYKLLEQLSPRQRRIVERRYGFDGDSEPTYEQLSEEEGITRERVRQIEKKACRIMKGYAEREQHKDNLQLVDIET